MIKSEVKRHGGVPTLFIDGKPCPPLAYITYLPERNRYDDFAEAGYKLFSVTTFFGRQTINESSQITPFSDGIFDKKGEPCFTLFDREVERVLEVCPDAKIFPRVNTALPKWWEDENPDELNDTGNGENRRRTCFSSDKYFETTKKFLLEFVDHVEKMPWRDSICAYQIAGGNTEEWFSFDNRGSVGKRAREKFAAECPEYIRLSAEELLELPDFYRYLSRAVVRVITELAHAVKERTGRRLAVGAFYGYSFETASPRFIHQALGMLLDSEDIDFLCSPASYSNRNPGCDFPNMTVIDSVILHGKLYFVEYDTRTHLTKYLDECRENAVVPGTYRDRIWLGPESEYESLHTLRGNFAKQLTHGYASWWFDMWGGWYHDEAIMRDMKAYREIIAGSIEDADRTSVSEIALFEDENSVAEDKSREAMMVAYDSRRAPGFCGAPYDMYDIRDFHAVAGRYKAAVFIKPARSEAIDECVRAFENAGGKAIILTKEKPKLTLEMMKELISSAGVHRYIESEDTLYINRNYAALIAAEAGEKKITLREKRFIKPILPEGEGFIADEICCRFEKNETKLFRLDEAR